MNNTTIENNSEYVFTLNSKFIGKLEVSRIGKDTFKSTVFCITLINKALAIKVRKSRITKNVK